MGIVLKSRSTSVSGMCALYYFSSLGAGCLQFADVVFIVDSSHSITSAGGGSNVYWVMQLDFISRIIDLIEVAPNRIRVGLVVFGTTVSTELRIEDDFQQNKANVLNRVKSLPFLGGTTATSAAIRQGTALLTANPRPGVRKIIFLLTDGVPNSRPSTFTEANIAKFNHDIIIATVGVNLDLNNIDRPESAFATLLEVSTRAELFYFVESFDNLLTQVTQVYSKVFCKSVCK
jgi:hypothetical protein